MLYAALRATDQPRPRKDQFGSTWRASIAALIVSHGKAATDGKATIRAAQEILNELMRTCREIGWTPVCPSLEKRMSIDRGDVARPDLDGRIEGVAGHALSRRGGQGADQLRRSGHEAWRPRRPSPYPGHDGKPSPAFIVQANAFAMLDQRDGAATSLASCTISRPFA